MLVVFIETLQINTVSVFFPHCAQNPKPAFNMGIFTTYYYSSLHSLLCSISCIMGLQFSFVFGQIIQLAQIINTTHLELLKSHFGNWLLESELCL